MMNIFQKFLRKKEADRPFEHRLDKLFDMDSIHDSLTKRGFDISELDDMLFAQKVEKADKVGDLYISFYVRYDLVGEKDEEEQNRIHLWHFKESQRFLTEKHGGPIGAQIIIVIKLFEGTPPEKYLLECRRPDFERKGSTISGAEIPVAFDTENSVLYYSEAVDRFKFFTSLWIITRASYYIREIFDL